jgi:hypothetical protein
MANALLAGIRLLNALNARPAPEFLQSITRA